MTKRIAIFLLLFCSSAFGQYLPSGDPNCVAWWRLETGFLTADSSANSNTLTNAGITGDSTVGDVKEGTSSGYFDGSSLMSILCSGLSAGFPMTILPYDQNYAVSTWFKFTVLPTSGADRDHALMSQIGGSKEETVYKAVPFYDEINYTQQAWQLSGRNSAVTDMYATTGLWLDYGGYINAGGFTLDGPFLASHSDTVDHTILVDNWYHIALSVDYRPIAEAPAGTTAGTYLVVVYDPGDDTTYTSTGYTNSYQDYAVGSAQIQWRTTPFENTYYLGAGPGYDDLSYGEISDQALPAVDHYFTGNMDDVTWYNMALTEAQINAIRDRSAPVGGYGGGSGTSATNTGQVIPIGMN